MSELNKNRNDPVVIKQFVDQVNFERTIEKIILKAKKIYEIALEVGFEEDTAFEYSNQYYRWAMGFDLEDDD